MKNRIEKLGSHETIEETNDIIDPMKVIEAQAFDAFMEGIGTENSVWLSSMR